MLIGIFRVASFLGKNYFKEGNVLGCILNLIFWQVTKSGGNANNGVNDSYFYLNCNNTSGNVNRNISGHHVLLF